MSHIADSRKSQGMGIWPLRHNLHSNKGWDIDMRSSVLGVSINDIEVGNIERLGVYNYDPESVGDVTQWLNWPRDSRPISGWSEAWPVIIDEPTNAGTPTPGGGPGSGGAPVQTGPGTSQQGHCPSAPPLDMFPVFDRKMMPDKTFKSIKPWFPEEDGTRLWPKFPKQYYGIAQVGTNTDEQIEYFMPTDPRLIAVNFDGDPEMGSFVCDLLPEHKIDKERIGRLQSNQWVIKKPVGCGTFFGRNSIAWNIGPSGCRDVRGGLVIDDAFGLSHTTGVGGDVPKVIGTTSQHLSGPFEVGSSTDKHHFGQDADGNPINAVHLSINSYFRMNDVADGPLRVTQWEQGDWGDHPRQVRFGWNGSVAHPFVCGPKDGMWDWYVKLDTYTPTIPPWIPPDTPTGDNPTPPGRPTGGGGGGSTDGGFGGTIPLPPPNQSPVRPFTTGDYEIDIHTHRNGMEFFGIIDFPGPHIPEDDLIIGTPVNELTFATAEQILSYQIRSATQLTIINPLSPGGPRASVPTARGYQDDTTPLMPGQYGQSTPPSGATPTPLMPGQYGRRGLNDSVLPFLPPELPPSVLKQLGGTLNAGQQYGTKFQIRPSPPAQGLQVPTVSTTREMSFPAILGRPQLIIQGITDLRNWQTPPIPLIQLHDITAPITFRAEAFGKQSQVGWSYTQRPPVSKYVGGTASGGFVFLPPEVTTSDLPLLNPAGVTKSTPYIVTGPGVYWGSGTPDLPTGTLNPGYRWGTPSLPGLPVKLKFEYLSGGVATDGLQLTEVGEVQIPLGVSGSWANAIGTVGRDISTKGNTAVAAEVDLNSVTIPALTLNVNQKGVRITASGLTAAAGGAKTVRLYFGTSVIQFNDVTGSPNNADWRFQAEVFLNDVGLEVYASSMTVGSVLQSTNAGPVPVHQPTNAPIVVKVTGQVAAAVANRVQCISLFVEAIT